jgi:quinol monooxygenase YgiN
MSLVVIAVWTARSGKEEQVQQVLEKMAPPSRAETGCLLYRLQRSRDDPRVFLLYEIYRSEEDYELHLSSNHFQRHAIKTGIPLLESRKRTFYNSFADPSVVGTTSSVG